MFAEFTQIKNCRRYIAVNYIYVPNTRLSLHEHCDRFRCVYCVSLFVIGNFGSSIDDGVKGLKCIRIRLVNLSPF